MAVFFLCVNKYKGLRDCQIGIARTCQIVIKIIWNKVINHYIFATLITKKNKQKMEKKRLNVSYLLNETIKKAYEQKDCLFLTRLIFVIIEQNPSIEFNINIRTLDWVIFDRLVKTLDDIDCEHDVQEEFSDVSENIMKFVEFAVQLKKQGKL